MIHYQLSLFLISEDLAISRLHKLIIPLIEKLATFMKLLDSFSIEPIVKFCNEGRDDIEKILPNVEKLYSPISIDNSLELF